MSGKGVQALADRIVASWIRNLPLTPGGYAENIDGGWREAPTPAGARERTSLAQMRLAYTFLHAGERGLEGALVAGRSALGRAHSIFWREELRGWIRSADERGVALDTTVDTYDQAFGLLALSWDRDPEGLGTRATASSRRLARTALAGLDEDAADRGGYREIRNGTRSSRLVAYPRLRRQNPHMHLLEAFLSWAKADPEGPWLDHAAAIVDLMRKRFIDPASGVLREYFDDSWRPAPGAPGSLLEPGHHFEWVWLLNEYRKLSGDGSVLAPAQALYDFAMERGVDDDALAFDGIDLGGAIVAGTKLLWPQTEQLKAHLAMCEWRGDEGARSLARGLLETIEKLYLCRDDGLFANQLDRAGSPLPVPTPSRVLYHLFLALAEAERVLGAEPKGSVIPSAT